MGWNLLSAKLFYYAQLWVKGYLHDGFGLPSPNSVDFYSRTKVWGEENNNNNNKPSENNALVLTHQTNKKYM